MENTNNNPTAYLFSVCKKNKSNPDMALKALDELKAFFSYHLIQGSSLIIGKLNKDGIEEKIYVASRANIARTFQNEAELAKILDSFTKKFYNEDRILEIHTIQKYIPGGQK